MFTTEVWKIIFIIAIVNANVYSSPNKSDGEDSNKAIPKMKPTKTQDKKNYSELANSSNDLSLPDCFTATGIYISLDCLKFENFAQNHMGKSADFKLKGNNETRTCNTDLDLDSDSEESIWMIYRNYTYDLAYSSLFVTVTDPVYGFYDASYELVPNGFSPFSADYKCKASPVPYKYNHIKLSNPYSQKEVLAAFIILGLLWCCTNNRLISGLKDTPSNSDTEGNLQKSSKWDVIWNILSIFSFENIIVCVAITVQAVKFTAFSIIDTGVNEYYNNTNSDIIVMINYYEFYKNYSLYCALAETCMVFLLFFLFHGPYKCYMFLHFLSYLGSFMVFVLNLLFVGMVLDIHGLFDDALYLALEIFIRICYVFFIFFFFFVCFCMFDETSSETENADIYERCSQYVCIIVKQFAIYILIDTYLFYIILVGDFWSVHLFDSVLKISFFLSVGYYAHYCNNNYAKLIPKDKKMSLKQYLRMRGEGDPRDKTEISSYTTPLIL